MTTKPAFNMSQFKAKAPLTDIELKLFEWGEFQTFQKTMFPVMKLDFKSRLFGGTVIKISPDSDIEAITNLLLANMLMVLDEYLIDDELEITQRDSELSSGLARLALRVLVAARGEQHPEVREFIQVHRTFLDL